MRYVATLGERQVTLEIGENGHLRAVMLEGQALDIDWHPVGGATLRPGAEGGHYSLLIGSRSFDVYVRAVESESGGDKRVLEVSIDGRPYVVQLEDERTRALEELAGAGHDRGEMAIRAPMPGLVSNVLAAAGQHVERGQTVVVLEAMKMENDLMAPRAGVVRTLRATKGQTVNQGDVLAVVGDPEGAPLAPPAEDTDE
jgi:biotin carboxyl carrier protein